MDTVPFSSSTLLYTDYNNPACSAYAAAGQEQTPLQIAQCKNAELGQWYNDNIEHTHAATVKLADIDAQITREHVQHMVRGGELLGIFAFLYYLTRL